MIARVKYKHHQDENGRGNREYWRREKALDEDETARGRRERKRDEKALDEALKNTFPASDPVSVEQPVLTATHE